MPRRAILTRDGEEALALSFKPLLGTPDFADALAKVKEIPGRRYDGDRKLWLLPAEPVVAERVLRSMPTECSADIEEWVKSARVQQAEEITTKLPEDAELHIPWAMQRAPWQPHFIEVAGEKQEFNGMLQHQRPVADLVARKRKLLICDDMGGGKTGEAISGIEEWRLREANDGDDEPVVADGPKLAIAPNSVLETWRDELTLWLGEDVPLQLIDATTKAARHNQLDRAIADKLWCVVNWEQVRAKKERIKVPTRNGGYRRKTVVNMREPLFEETDWQAVIADEIHRAKNRKSQQFLGLMRCRADSGVMLGLSGTPLMNSPDELWALLHWLWPKEYTSYWRFYTQYVEFYEGHFGRVITGVKNADALRFELHGRIVRRTQSQMGIATHGKMRIPVPIVIAGRQRKLYEEAESQMWLKVIEDAEGGDAAAQNFARIATSDDGGVPASKLYALPNGAARTVRLRQIIETPANLGGPDESAVLDACVDRIMDSRPEPWVVFCEFKPTTACLAERLRKRGLNVAVYHGDVESGERGEIKRSFQAGDIDVIVGTIKALKEGITLTAGNRQFWVSRDWVPDNNEQGEDRQNRIGQRREVLVFIAQPKNTVATTKVAPKNRLKERIVRAIVPKDHIKEAAPQ